MEIALFFMFFLSLIFFNFPSKSDDKIISSPLINLEKIKPSFEEEDAKNENQTTTSKLKNKKKESIENSQLY